MEKGHPSIEEIFNELYEQNPEIKKQVKEDNLKRQERKQALILGGLSEEDATIQSWEEYWVMVEERDGVRFSISKIT